MGSGGAWFGRSGFVSDWFLPAPLRVAPVRSGHEYPQRGPRASPRGPPPIPPRNCPGPALRPVQSLAPSLSTSLAYPTQPAPNPYPPAQIPWLFALVGLDPAQLVFLDEVNPEKIKADGRLHSVVLVGAADSRRLFPSLPTTVRSAIAVLCSVLLQTTTRPQGHRNPSPTTWRATQPHPRFHTPVLPPAKSRPIANNHR